MQGGKQSITSWGRAVPRVVLASKDSKDLASSISHHGYRWHSEGVLGVSISGMCVRERDRDKATLNNSI